MLTQDIKSTVQAYLLPDIENGSSGNIYFDFYYSSKTLGENTAIQIVENTIGSEEISSQGILEDNGYIIRISGSPILFWQVAEERWLITYSSRDLPQSNRRKLSKAHKKVGWLLPVQFESQVVDDIYHDFSPQEESVNIERKWDPYWIYERGSEIPENLRDYYRENIEEFVEKEIEFNVKTPGWLVDTTFKQGVQEELLNKSEISKSRFTYDPNVSPKKASDGGVSSQDFRSNITIRQEGKVVHRSGVPEATFSLMDEMQMRDDLFEELSTVIPERDYYKRDNGIVEVEHFKPGGTLTITFEEKDFNEEASITLSNLLTIGQDDVKLHGVIHWRDELEFLAETYTPFDEGEYRILFTSHELEDQSPRASLKINPKSATTAGLIYIFRKLKEKFDPRIEYEIERTAHEEVAK